MGREPPGSSSCAFCERLRYSAVLTRCGRLWKQRSSVCWLHVSVNYIYCLICNCNWGTCIAPFTRRLRAHHRVSLINLLSVFRSLMLCIFGILMPLVASKSCVFVHLVHCVAWCRTKRLHQGYRRSVLLPLFISCLFVFDVYFIF